MGVKFLGGENKVKTRYSKTSFKLNCRYTIVFVHCINSTITCFL